MSANRLPPTPGFERSGAGQTALQEFAGAATSLGAKPVPDEPLARHTTFRIGGPADLYAAADNTALLEAMVELAAACGVPFTVLGGGSNVLIADAGVRGLVIGNSCREMRLGEPPTGAPARAGVPQVIADSGAALAGLARWTIRQGLTGLEWAVSVPGTVGGAVVGNAGAHGCDIAANLAWALVIYPGQGQHYRTAAELQYAYRGSLLKRELVAPPGRGPAPVVLQAGFNLESGDPSAIAARAETYLARRRATQPVGPSAGSVFRNPPGEHAGRLVEAAGLKGHQIGGAQISPRHANFIVNTGTASAADVLALINLMCERVYQQFGVELVPEIFFLGDWPNHPPYNKMNP
jgi:UDP-N-acetylmuramate dehydrogenase